MDFEQLLFSYQGRLRRSHWWVARLCLGFVLFVMFLVGVAIWRALGPEPDKINLFLLSVMALLLLGLWFWVDLALSVKRLHDLNWTGWLVLLVFVPTLGSLFSLVCLGIMDGTAGRNQFGPSPKFPDSDAEAFT